MPKRIYLAGTCSARKLAENRDLMSMPVPAARAVGMIFMIILKSWDRDQLSVTGRSGCMLVLSLSAYGGLANSLGVNTGPENMWLSHH